MLLLAALSSHRSGTYYNKENEEAYIEGYDINKGLNLEPSDEENGDIVAAPKRSYDEAFEDHEEMEAGSSHGIEDVCGRGEGNGITGRGCSGRGCTAGRGGRRLRGIGGDEAAVQFEDKIFGIAD